MKMEWMRIADGWLGVLATGVYQGILVTLVVGFGLKIFRGTNAATRYAVGMVALVIVALLPGVHHVLLGGEGELAAGVEGNGGVFPEQFRLVGPGETGDGMLGELRMEGTAGVVGFEPKVEDLAADSVLPPAVVAAGDAELHRSFSLDEAEHLRPVEGVWRSGEVPAPAESGGEVGLDDGAGLWAAIPFRWDWRPAIPRWAGLVVIGLWLAIAGVRLAALGRQYHCLHRIKRGGASVGAPLRSLFAGLGVEMGIGRRARLLAVPGLAAPMVVGFCRPAVLFPTELVEGAGEDDWERVLRHELAHLHRRDDWTNLLQQTIRAVLFFHPAVWWLSRRLTIDREIACDDYVLSAMKSRKTYALLLTEFADRGRNRDWSAAPAAWSNKGQLNERIHMILDPKRNASPRPAFVRTGTFTIAALIMAAAAVQSAPRLAFGREPSSTGITEIRSTGGISQGVSAAPGGVASIQVAPTSGAAVRPAANLALPDRVASTPPSPAGPGPQEPRPVSVSEPSSGRAVPEANMMFPEQTLATSTSKDEATEGVEESAGVASDEESVARRLERLEQLVQSLVQKKPKQTTVRPSGDSAVLPSDDLESSAVNIPEVTLPEVTLPEVPEVPPPPSSSPSLDLLGYMNGANAEKEGRVGVPDLHHFLFSLTDPRRPEDQKAWQRKFEQAMREAEQASRQARQTALEAQRMAQLHTQHALELLQQNDFMARQRQILEQQRDVLQKRMKALEEELRALDDQLKAMEDLETEDGSEALE